MNFTVSDAFNKAIKGVKLPYLKNSNYNGPANAKVGIHYQKMKEKYIERQERLMQE